MATPDQAAKEILLRLKTTEPPAWVAYNPSLHQEARTALLHLFSTINPFSPKSPFEQLLIDGFDNEQIWQQMDLQSHHLIPGVRREVRRYDKNHNEISRLFREVNNTTGGEKSGSEEKVAGGTESENLDGFDDMDVDGFDEDEESEEEIGEQGKKGGIEDAEESGSDEGEGDEEDEEEEGKESGGIEDGFLKIKELVEYLEEDEAREYGLEDAGKSSKKEMKAKRKDLDESSEEDGEDEEGEDDDQDDDDEEGDELGAFEADEDGEETDKLARYEDFFGAKKRKISKREPKLADESEELSTDNEGDDHDDGVAAKKKQNNLSTHEKELLDLKAKIEQMEKANLEPKAWTMQGEVTAAKRPKNSALEVDLDFEHNARPAPVITEEVTASLEELIRRRILEGHYDDVQKRPSLPTKAPREFKELDENKSKKGLAEIYEEEYAQKTNLVAAPLSFTDEQKKEAASLFKRLCLKLDALSHFNFAPKPVIEDMSIQSNVPALAMEEIAPLAVSDAAMLAPEEVFAGKGDIKDEAELTQAERKRRRANKKRKYKAESAKRAARKGSTGAMLKRSEGNED